MPFIQWIILADARKYLTKTSISRKRTDNRKRHRMSFVRTQRGFIIIHRVFLKQLLNAQKKKERPDHIRTSKHMKKKPNQVKK
jgi:hypothetical protein